MKRIIMGIFGAALFYGAMIGLTRFASAEPDELPITPPITPPDVTVTPTPEPSPTPVVTEGLATGGVKAMMDGEEVKLNFNAHGGSDLKGKIMYKGNGMSFRGDVDVCYNQSGNEATFGGTVRSGDATGQYFVASVQDNGEGKKADPDMVGVWVSEVMPDCATADFQAEVMKGNLQVH